MYEIEITVDRNDADYKTELSWFDDPDKLNKILPLIRKISDKLSTFVAYEVDRGNGLSIIHQSNWPSGECYCGHMGEKTPQELYDLTDEEVEEFESLCPHSETGFHTIMFIAMKKIEKSEHLFEFGPFKEVLL